MLFIFAIEKIFSIAFFALTKFNSIDIIINVDY